MSGRVTRKRVAKYESDVEEPVLTESEDDTDAEIDEQSSDEEDYVEEEEEEEPVPKKSKSERKAPAKKKKRGALKNFLLDDVDVDDDEDEDDSDFVQPVSARERREAQKAREKAIEALKPKQKNRFAGMSEDQMLAYFEDRYGQEPDIDPDQEVSDEEYDSEYDDFSIEQLRSIKRRARSRVAKKQSLPFLVGDNVEVVEGEMEKLRGKVQSSSRDTVIILPYHKDLTKPIPFHPSQLCKFFSPGDHVQITEGDDINATGIVVRCYPDEVIILSDLNMEELSASPQDVRLFVHVAAGGEFKDYQQTLYGIGLKKQEKGSMNYFTKRDFVVNHRQKYDYKQDEIVGKTVRILQGPMKGYLGIAKDANKAVVRVELHSQPRIITVDRSRVSLV